MPDFVRVADIAEIPDPGKTLVEVDGDMVVMSREGHVERLEALSRGSAPGASASAAPAP